jgi:hypothetical protein
MHCSERAQAIYRLIPRRNFSVSAICLVPIGWSVRWPTLELGITVILPLRPAKHQMNACFSFPTAPLCQLPLGALRGGGNSHAETENSSHRCDGPFRHNAELSVCHAGDQFGSRRSRIIRYTKRALGLRALPMLVAAQLLLSALPGLGI